MNSRCQISYTFYLIRNLAAHSEQTESPITALDLWRYILSMDARYYLFISIRYYLSKYSYYLY